MREPQVQVREGLAAILAEDLHHAAVTYGLLVPSELSLSPLVVHAGGVYRPV